jgi:hypothetical protein
MKQNTSSILLKFLAVMLVLGGMFVGAIAQQRPSTPKNFDLVESIDASGMQTVKLTWERGDNGVMPDYYYIYVSVSIDGGDDSLNQHEFVIRQEYENKSLNGKHEHTLFLNQMQTGTYELFVKSVITSGTGNYEVMSEKSNSKTYTFKYDEPFMIYVNSNTNEYKIGDEIQLYTYIYGVEEDCDVTIDAKFDESALKLISESSELDSMYGRSGKLYTFEALKNGKHLLEFSAVSCTGEAASYALSLEVGVFNNSQLLYFDIQRNNPDRIYLGDNDLISRTYTVTKAPDFNCPVEYKIETTSLKDATIDENGKVTAPNIPENYGKHYVSILVSSVDCEYQGQLLTAQASGWFELLILDESQRPNAKIIGKVTDRETGEPVGGAFVYLYGTFANDNNRDSNFYHENYFYTSTDAEGNYEVDVNAGNYIIVVQGYGYQQFVNLTDPNDPLGLEILANTTTTFDAQLDREIVPEYVTFSGQVTSSETGEGIAHAVVEFIPSEFVGKGGIIGCDSTGNPLDWGHFYGQFVTKTDENGNYTLQVVDNMTYVARAFGFEMNTGMPMGEEYYNEKANPFDADILDPKVDYFAPINFTLDGFKPQLGNISGSVVNDKDEPMPATVLAIRMNDRNTPNDGQNVFTSIARDGNFYFDNVPYGKYVLLSVPMTLSHIPGYYVSNGLASLNWNEATVIGVDEITVALQYTIQHQSLVDGLDGIADFDGKISKRGGVVKSGNGTLSAKGLSGVTVYLLNDKGETLDYKFTDKDGNFKFNKLPEGKYKIVTDKFGFYSSNANFEVKYSNGLKITQAMEMEENLLMSIEDETISDVKVMPQPANTNAKIEFLANNGNVEVNIIDQTGRLLDNLNINTTEGVNYLDINTTRYSNGTYFIILNQNDSSKSIKFNVVK